LLSTIGLGFLFLLAGYELDPALLRAREGRLAATSWVASLALAAVVMGVLYEIGDSSAPVVVAIALTTTALGTLLPILRDNDMLSGPFGRFVFAAGGVGEIGPILAMALFLGAAGAAVELVALFLLLLLALVAWRTPRLLERTRLGAIIIKREHTTSQTTLRITIAVLFVFLLASANLGFDSILGAFVAGMLVRAWSPGETPLFEAKLDAVGYGFFIPVFFICSGMALDVSSIVDNPLPLVMFLALMFVIRGLPALFWYRRDLQRVERWQMVFITATALPLLVALTAVGVASGQMTTATQASIVGAGVVSVLVFPILAIELQRRKLSVSRSATS
jgi:Kef-type K+ transport system membrane component KefB